MGLPHPDTAKTWGGKLLVDRDGVAIGTCTEIFVDDATGLPEWATADASGGSVFVPLLEAAESADGVRVDVLHADVAGAPTIDHAGHLSPDEEERLYRHYGITTSPEASESLLPAPSTGPAEHVDAQITEHVAEHVDEHVAEHVDEHRGRLPSALAAGTVGTLAAVGAAVFWRRQHQQLPPTRQELLAARARAATLAVAARRESVMTSAAPLLRSGRHLSATAAQQLAVHARAVSERAAVQARAAAEQAAALAAAAGTLRLQRVPGGADVAPPVVIEARGGRQKLVAVLQALGGFAAGYALRARAGEPGAEQLEKVPSWAQRPQLRQNVGRVQERATRTLQAANSQVNRGAGAIVERVGRRSGGSGDDLPGSGTANRSA